MYKKTIESIKQFDSPLLINTQKQFSNIREKNQFIKMFLNVLQLRKKVLNTYRQLSKLLLLIQKTSEMYTSNVPIYRLSEFRSNFTFIENLQYFSKILRYPEISVSQFYIAIVFNLTNCTYILIYIYFNSGIVIWKKKQYSWLTDIRFFVHYIYLVH